MQVEIDGEMMTITPDDREEAYILTAWMLDFFSEEGTADMQMAIHNGDIDEIQDMIDAHGVRH